MAAVACQDVGGPAGIILVAAGLRILLPPSSLFNMTVLGACYAGLLLIIAKVAGTSVTELKSEYHKFRGMLRSRMQP
jgi:hypothetical protein